MGVPKPGSSKPDCLQFLRGSALLRSFAPFCGLAFALLYAHLRSFALICVFLRPTAFRRSAFGNCGFSVPCQRNRQNTKPEPHDLFYVRTVASPNRSVATLRLSEPPMAQAFPDLLCRFFARPLCRNLSGLLVVSDLEAFARDFPGWFFWANSPHKK